MKNLDDLDTLLNSEENIGGASVRFERERDFALVEGWGELDLANIPEFQQALEDSLRADAAIIVDLGRVTYIDSSGFNALLETSRIAHSLGLTMYLAACNPNIARILEVTRLDRLFEVVDTIEDARAEAGRLAAAAAPTA